MAFSKEQIITALSTVNDPDIKRDLVSLGMIKDVEVNDHIISFTVVLTTPACPLKEKIRKDCEEAIKNALGQNVKVNIRMTATVTTGRENAPLLPGVKNIIAVGSGKGG
ncbi:MAG: iron-sulfur cluster assembly protein, partial [Flammeovirgaceae bacterium]